MKLTYLKKILQNVQFFKSYARDCITHYAGRAASVDLSVHWAIHWSISPSAGLLVSDNYYFLRLKEILMSLLQPKCFLVNFITTPTHQYTTCFPFYAALFFCRARCFLIGLCKIVRREPGWLFQKNH